LAEFAKPLILPLRGGTDKRNSPRRLALLCHSLAVWPLDERGLTRQETDLRGPNRP